MPGQHDHGAALTDVARPGLEIGEPSSTPTLAMTGEMMLDHEELAEAQSIGLHHILDEALVALAVLETGSVRLVTAPPKSPNCLFPLPRS